MKKLMFFLVISTFSLLSCGISKEEHEKAINQLENEKAYLNSEIERLNKELDLYRYGEEKLLALIENAYLENKIVIARQNIDLFIKYHPQSVDNQEFAQLVSLVEQEEEEERLARETAAEERRQRARLASIGNTADNPIIIEARWINDAVSEIILNRDKYLNKYIMIKNTWWDGFGIRKGSLGGPEWFLDIDTFMFNETNSMYSNKFAFYFHPQSSDTDARRLMIELNGKQYRSADKFNICGKLTTVNEMERFYQYIFLVDYFEMEGHGYKRYNGIFPNSF
jgi:outer membrane murein-binding lipoprotein Lpp